MKIELHETTNPTDILNRLMALMSYHEYLIGEVREVELTEDNEDRYGHTILIQLQISLIKAAIEKQDAINATRLKSVNA